MDVRALYHVPSAVNRYYSAQALTLNVVTLHTNTSQIVHSNMSSLK